jgi:hypothetical protein
MMEVRDEVHEQKSVLWRFNVICNFSGEITLRLEEYAVCERQTKRHKWKKVKHWSTYDERWSSIRREDVPALPDFIKHRALKALSIEFEMPQTKAVR